MDVTAITTVQKSAIKSDKIIEDIDELKATIDREPESVNTSPIVDNINDSINSPYRYVDRNNVKIFRKNCAVCLEGSEKKKRENIFIPTWPAVANESVKRNGRSVVRYLRNVDSSITSRKILSTIAMEKNGSFKSLRSGRLSSSSKENVSPETKTGDKPIRTAFTCAKRILLRSSRKRTNGILNKNISQLSGKIFGDDEVDTTNRNSETNFHSSLKDITEKSTNLENDRRQNISDNSSLLKDALISQVIKKEGNANAQIESVDETIVTDDRDSIDKKLTIDSPSGSSDLVKNVTSPRKTYQMRKRREPFDNERIDKRKIQSSILTKNKNDCKCFSKAVEETEKYDDDSKPDEVSPKECVIICTPDINIDFCTGDRKADEKSEEFSKKDEETEEFTKKDEETEEFSENGENKLETGSENIDFGEKVTRNLKREGQGTPDRSPKRKLRHTNAQTMPVFESGIAVAKNEKFVRMEGGALPQTIERSANASDCGKDEHKPAKDLSSLDKDTPNAPKNVFTNLVNAKTRANKLLCIENVIPLRKAGDIDADAVGCEKINKRAEEDPSPRSASVGNKIARSKDSEYSYHPSIDSDETLSNVESIESSPTSPAHEALPVVTAKNRRNMSKKRIEPRNVARSDESEKDVTSILRRLSADIRVTNITDCANKDLRSTGKTRKLAKTGIGGTFGSAAEKQKSKRRDGIKFQFSPNRTLSSSDESAKKCRGGDENEDDDLDVQRSVSWLRHYERPRRTQNETIKGIAEVEKHGRIIPAGKTPRNSSRGEKINVAAGDLASENRRRENGRGIAGSAASKEQNNNDLLNADNRTNIRKRGRPRKQTGERSNPDLNKNKKPRIDKDKDKSRSNHEQSSAVAERSSMERNADEQSSNGAPPSNGSALTLLELQHLFFKFLQHGHFRIDFEHPIVDMQKVNSHENCSTRMRCYDQKEYYMPPNCNLDVTNFESAMNPQLNKCFQAENSGNGIYRSKTSNFDLIDRKFESMNPNLNPNTEFSGVFGSQMSYSRNTSHCSTRAATSCWENLGTGVTDGIDGGADYANLWNYNSTVPANTNSLVNCAQSKESNYQQDFHNNNNNNNNDLLDNNSYSHCYSGIMNSNDLSNNGNIGTEGMNILSGINNNIIDDTSFDQSIRNSMPLVKTDSAMSDGNGMSHSSTISMRNNSFLNDLNTDWNFEDVNQRLDSANEYSMDRNTMGCDNKQSQASGGISDTSNLTCDSNLIINDSNLWMNRPNNTMNQGFSVRRPWHEALPIYNPYLNNENLHYGDMFSSCGAFVGFNSSNKYPFSNGGDNVDPWMQNTFSSTENEGNSATHIPSNGQFSGMSSGSYRTNNFGFTEGMNFSLLGDALGDTTMNMIDPNGDNSGIANENKLNSTIEQFSENSASLAETNENNKMMQGISQLSDSYSIEYENCKQSLDFNGTGDGGVRTDAENNIGNQKRENIIQVHDYVDEKLQNFENCFEENYTELTNCCKTVISQSNNHENELSKLRQELADFTKQYSENQIGPDSTKNGLNASIMMEKY